MHLSCLDRAILYLGHVISNKSQSLKVFPCAEFHLLSHQFFQTFETRCNQGSHPPLLPDFNITKMTFPRTSVNRPCENRFLDVQVGQMALNMTHHLME